MRILALMILAISANAQITVQGVNTKPTTTVGKVAPAGQLVAKMIYVVEGADTLYSIVFQNQKYSIVDIQVINFTNEDNTFNTLYGLCKSVFLPENKSKGL